MKKALKILFLLLSVIGMLVLNTLNVYAAHNAYYVDRTGSDSNSGISKSAPFATIRKALDTYVSGDTIYLCGDTIKVNESEIMTTASSLDASHYCYTFDLKKAGTASGRTVISGYRGERPVLDFSGVKPTCRIVALALNSDYLHLKNFEIVGVQATCHGHYQSIAIYAVNSSYSIVENIAIHNNKSIGYYATHGHDNVVKNCDSYKNFDNYSAFKTDADYESYISTGTVRNVSETLGGNSDGFGFHACHVTDKNNKFEGCRAWWNADDGFDCINSKAAVEWSHCWSFYNGFEPNGNTQRGDGNGFKSGGYGMSVPCSGFPGTLSSPQAPQNYIHHCVAFYNKTNGFYANHHLGGNLWENNTAMYNYSSNYSMVNRDSTLLNTEESTGATKGTDIDGYNHILRNNVSYAPKTSGNNWTNINYDACTFTNNAEATADQFLDCTRLSYSKMAQIELCTVQRNADGTLPAIKFLTAKKNSSLYINNQGALFEDNATDIKGISEKGTNHSQQKTMKAMVKGNLVIRKADGSLYTIIGEHI